MSVKRSIYTLLFTFSFLNMAGMLLSGCNSNNGPNTAFVSAEGIGDPCVTEADCPNASDFRCMNGTCQFQCNSDGECPENYACSSANICVEGAGGGDSNGICASRCDCDNSNQICDNGECRLGGLPGNVCETDEECGRGADQCGDIFCLDRGDAKICARKACAVDADCERVLGCDNGICTCSQATFQCEPTAGCSVNADCPNGQICDRDATGLYGQCITPQQCAVDQDCPTGQQCEIGQSGEGICITNTVGNPCTTNRDCGSVACPNCTWCDNASGNTNEGTCRLGCHSSLQCNRALSEVCVDRQCVSDDGTVLTENSVCTNNAGIGAEGALCVTCDDCQSGLGCDIAAVFGGGSLAGVCRPPCPRECLLGGVLGEGGDILGDIFGGGGCCESGYECKIGGDLSDGVNLDALSGFCHLEDGLPPCPGTQTCGTVENDPVCLDTSSNALPTGLAACGTNGACPAGYICVEDPASMLEVCAQRCEAS